MELRRRLRVRAIVLVAAAAALITAAFGVPAPTAQAAQTVPYKMNFQGRLTDNSGNVLSDGLYNVKFRLWTLGSGGTNMWEGDRVRGASDYRVQITNGLFNIQFGDTTLGDPALSPSLFATGAAPLYLEVELPTPATATCATNGCASFTEGAMTPRQPLASAAYAFNSDTLDGLDSASFGQLSTNNTFTGANTFQPASGVGLTVRAASATSSFEVKDSGGTTRAYFDASGILNLGQAPQPTSSNTVDLGTASLLFRTGYFGTSVQTPALNVATAGGTLTTNFGSLQRTAAGTTTIDLKDSANTTLAITSTGTGIAGLNVEGNITIGSGQFYQINGTQISSANLSNDAAITKQGNTFNGVSQLVQTNGSGALPTLSGANLTSLNPTNLTTGSGAVTLQSAASTSLSLATTGTGAINVTPGTGGVAYSFAAGVTAAYTASAAMTADQITQTNTSATNAPTADGINLLQQTYFAKPASGNMQSATRINFTNANTAAAGQVQGIRLVGTGAGGTINSDTVGILIDALANASTGTAGENALEIGSGWDAGFSIASGGNVIRTATDTAAAFGVQTSGSVSVLSVDTEATTDPLQVQIGSTVADATQINLALDSSNVFTETQTCATTTNQGAMYYNTASNAVRSCVNGAWEDLVTTGGLGLLAYGVIADTGATPGDLAGKASTTAASGPCKVGWLSATSVSVTACSAYSGGRKVVVAATTVTGITITANNWTHICLSSTSGQPVKSTAGTETANLTTAPIAFSTASPVVCLADIRGTGGGIQIYDTRVFTNSVKTWGYTTAAMPLGSVAKASTDSVALPGTAANNTSLRGVVVATNGAAWAAGNGPNAIIVTGGPVWAKATAGTAGVGVQTSTTTSGYAFTNGTASTGLYGNLGMAETSFVNTCSTGANCNLSLLFTVNIR